VNEIYLLFLAGGLLAIAWLVARPPAVFVVTVSDGAPNVKRGKVTEAFLRVVEEVCREFDVKTAEIRGVARGPRIALHFSSRLPLLCRQRLRNWWAISGWSAKPQRDVKAQCGRCFALHFPPRLAI